MPRANQVVADVLGELADLVAITGGDRFRVRAYEKAARSVAAHPVDVAELDRRALEAIPSVGSHIGAKIAEHLRTGKVTELDELHARVPAGLRSLLEVPGLGPTRARQVYEELHISSVPELHISSVPELLGALKEHRLRDLRGCGAASETRLARAVGQYRGAGDRMQMDAVLELAEELVAGLRPAEDVSQLTYVGSPRRMRETVGDVDLLAAASGPGPVMDAFAAHPLVAEVYERGPTKAAGVTVAGIHVDLRVVTPEVWGAALMYFTGSKVHNVHLRRVAKRAGLKLSEYGLSRARDGAVLASATETEANGRLGMDYVLPTLREDRGEVEAALAGELPARWSCATCRATSTPTPISPTAWRRWRTWWRPPAAWVTATSP